MTTLFWIDFAAAGLFTVISAALMLIALSAGLKNPVNRTFSLFAALQTAKGICSVYLRISLWLGRGNPQHWANWEGLLFFLTAVLLLFFTVTYLGQSTRKHFFVYVLTGVAILVTCGPILGGGVITRARLDAAGNTLVTLTPLGFLISSVPLLYYAWALALFQRTPGGRREPFMSAAILIMLSGFVLGAVINIPFPVLSFTELVSMAVIGYGVLSRQLFNPLRQTTEDLRRQIDERKQAEKALKHLLAEKEVLLREVHHRVKNNLQVVSSLLHLQSQDVRNRRVLGLFEESRNRIHSMALIHEQLYGTASFTDVHFSDYAGHLIRNLLRSYGRPGRSIDVITRITVRHMNIGQAIPCGLVLNEIVSNAMKYAFPVSFRGRPRLSIRMSAGRGGLIALSVSDNGIGMPRGKDLRTASSMGMRLIRILVEDQLKGSVRMETGRNRGTAYRIKFKAEAESAPESR
ncbi:sensor histidine kinase [bacterium]|nr:sensor histidine kinase [bacterium]